MGLKNIGLCMVNSTFQKDKFFNSSKTMQEQKKRVGGWGCNNTNYFVCGTVTQLESNTKLITF